MTQGGPASAPISRPALPRRLMAMLYDTFLVLPLIMVGVAIASGLQRLLSAAVSGAPASDDVLAAWAVQLLAVVLCTGFFSAFWLKGGQTLGMQAWRVKLVAQPGHRLTIGRCVLRCLAAVLSILPAGLGYWWCLFDRHGRYWHDHLSGTELILLPARAKPANKTPPKAPSA